MMLWAFNSTRFFALLIAYLISATDGATRIFLPPYAAAWCERSLVVIRTHVGRVAPDWDFEGRSTDRAYIAAAWTAQDNDLGKIYKYLRVFWTKDRPVEFQKIAPHELTQVSLASAIKNIFVFKSFNLNQHHCAHHHNVSLE